MGCGTSKSKLKVPAPVVPQNVHAAASAGDPPSGQTPTPLSTPVGSPETNSSSLEISTGTPQSPVRSSANPRVFMDVSINNQPAGRIVFLLRADVVPKTAENFRALCTGERIGSQGKPLTYKGSKFHRGEYNHLLHGGNITNDFTTRGESIYGLFFDDENFILKHDEPGVLCMANDWGPNTNGSEFLVMLQPNSWYDGRNVVFGKVIEGMDVVKAISGQPANEDNDRLYAECVITNCGQL